MADRILDTLKSIVDRCMANSLCYISSALQPLERAARARKGDAVAT